MSGPLSTEKSQYHHFIPRFILRNFAHPYQPPKDLYNGTKQRNRQKKRGSHRPGEPMLNIINTEGDAIEILETTVAKTLGMMDMYRDFRGQTKQHHLEEKLSKLEARAGQVISKIRQSLKARNQEVCITRTQRNDLRKFLFIMKYRGSGMHKRYFHSDADEYSQNDKQMLRKHMEERGLKSPIHVWFENIDAMLEVDMDEKMAWMKKLGERVYQSDAAWFIMHCQMMYLALCTPSKQGDEFILTENAYSIFEGPATCYVDPFTKKVTQGAWSELHMFAPISPKLMIVLRSSVFPISEEDSDEEMRSWRHDIREQMAAQLGGPEGMRSMLEHLPVHKARNSYSKIVNGQVVLREGETGSHRRDDKFYFSFFSLPKMYTDRLNFLMLENASHISTIVFNSRQVFSQTIKAYLDTSCEVEGRPCLKLIDGTRDDERLKFLKKLECLSSILNVASVAVYQNLEATQRDPLVTLGQRFQTMAVQNNDDLWEHLPAYCRLGQSQPSITRLCLPSNIQEGGNYVVLPKDMDQASKMLTLRIKIDVWSQGLSPSQREDVRQKLGQLFCQLPPRRIWMYLKQVRLMLINKGRRVEVGKKPSEIERQIFQRGEGAEDIVAHGRTRSIPDSCSNLSLLTSIQAHLLVHPNRVGHLLWFAAINDLFRGLPIGPAGSISDCGIRPIQEAARSYVTLARMSNLQESISTPKVTSEENLEIMGRSHVRYHFADLFGHHDDDDKGNNDGEGPNLDMNALKRVLFDVIYPCPGN